MKKILAFYIFIFISIPTLCAQNLDDLSQKAITYAAQNNVEALREIYAQHRSELPHHFALYCDIALARSEGDYERVTLCVDSLYKWYPKYLQKKSRLALAEIKADALRKTGKYAELSEHCTKEIKYFSRYGFAKSSLQTLYLYHHKAEELSKNDCNTELLRYYDRKEVFKLDSVYQEKGKDADELTQLRCEFLLYQTFHQPQRLLEVTQQLLEKYAAALDVDERTACINRLAEVLIFRGDWEALSVELEAIEQQSLPHAAPINHYLQWAAAFKVHPKTSITCTHSPCAIPTSYEWPLIVEGTINQHAKIKFCVGTEQPYILISEDFAQQHHLKMLTDTLQISTNKGLQSVSPAIIDQFALGSMTYEHLFAYVVHKSDTSSSALDNVLGLSFWLNFDKLYFHPEQLIVEYCTETERDKIHKSAKNLFLSEPNGLQVLGHTQQGPRILGVDWCYPNNLLYQKAWKQETDNLQTTLSIGENEYEINQPQWVDYKSCQNDGILGVPFLRHYQSVCFDFTNMCLSARGRRDYTPQRKRFSYTTDRHYLARNADAILTGESEDAEEALFLHLLMAEGKNRPEDVVAFSQQLHECHSDFYNPQVEAHARFQLGEYASAAEILRIALQTIDTASADTQKEKKILDSLLHKYQCYIQEQAKKINGKATKVTLPLKKEELPLLRIHRKKAEGLFDMFSPVTEISEKYVKRFKVKRLGTTDEYDYGLIPTLKIGELTLTNLPCHILKRESNILQRIPDKGKGIRLGWDVLRLFRQVSFGQQEITLSTIVHETMDHSARLYHTGEWYIEVTSENGYCTYAISDDHTAPGIPEEVQFSGINYPASAKSSPTPHKGEVGTGKINFSSLKSQCSRMTFDFKEMQLKSK